MPTLLEVAGIEYPDHYQDKERVALEGISMLPYLVDPEKSMPDRSLFWQHETHSAARKGTGRSLPIMTVRLQLNGSSMTSRMIGVRHTMFLISIQTLFQR